ncbi:MAG: Crp/Fnr family transcriptional regulator [Candidatus Marinimicrobia bacterium]|nr:Crp/Fnr family transcriptional regulator [Candidatus Neomarinimicrobiota bacterium]MCF7828123.1 Crp/Fnr family transcriptional regulator [Candidatus Neomarinimicrobiota bacterium]MCF7879702.1 Crp/Fnr family transcriptional regulator [Candidatus Neomarinimicrobiota bacterium]
MDKMWYLKQIDIFQDLKEPQLQKVEKFAIHKFLKKKELVYLPGDRSDKVYLLKEGRVKVSRLSEDGKEMTMVILEPGEIFGESALYSDSKTRSTMAEALDDALVCTVYRRDFEDMLKNQPELSLKLTKEIGKRRREIESRLEDMVFRSVPGRLAHLLLNLAEKYGVEKPEGLLLDVPLTHLEIANLIGSTRETTTTELNNLKREGLIAVKKRDIYLTDVEGLEDLAEVYE